MNYGQYLTFERKGSIGIITLNRPEKLNVINTHFINEMMAIQSEIMATSVEQELRAIAMVSTGKHFSAGIDLEHLKEASAKRSLLFLHYEQQCLGFWQTMPLPVVAGIQGACIGAGFELALACDIRIAGEHAKLSLPEVNYGLSPDFGGATRLTKLVGPGRAKMILFSAESISAEEALSYGIVQKIVPGGQVQEATIALAEQFAKKPPIAIQMAKKSVNIAVESSYSTSILAEQMQGIYCVGTKDNKEAAAAFLEKREPSFQGE